MKQQFFLKMTASRPAFMTDMTPDERLTMQNHVGYWTDLLAEQTAIVFGPVFDPKGGYGIGVVKVDNEEQLKTIIANDPANGLNTCEYYQMKAIFGKNG